MFLQFPLHAGDGQEFDGNDRFFPINYLEHWKVVREIAEATGTPFNKSAYDAEAKREAEARAKKQQAPASNSRPARHGSPAPANATPAARKGEPSLIINA